MVAALVLPGRGYAGMEQGEQSVEAYKHALRLSPSNIQVMTELVEVFFSRWGLEERREVH